MAEILILCIVKEKTGILNYRRFGTGATKIVHSAATNQIHTRAHILYGSAARVNELRDEYLGR